MSIALTSPTPPAPTRSSAPVPQNATVTLTLTVELPARAVPHDGATHIAALLHAHALSFATPLGGTATVNAARVPRTFTQSSGQHNDTARSALPPRRGQLQPVPLRPRTRGIVSPTSPAKRDAEAAQLRVLRAAALSQASPVRAPGTTSVPRRSVRGTASAGAFSSAAVPGLVIDLYGRRVRIDGNDVDFAHREFELLAYLASHARSVVTREQLLGTVWRDTTGATGERTIDVHVRRVRAKLGRYRKLISTVRGSGYRLDPGSDVTIIE